MTSLRIRIRIIIPRMPLQPATPILQSQLQARSSDLPSASEMEN